MTKTICWFIIHSCMHTRTHIHIFPFSLFISRTLSFSLRFIRIRFLWIEQTTENPKKNKKQTESKCEEWYSCCLFSLAPARSHSPYSILRPSTFARCIHTICVCMCVCAVHWAWWWCFAIWHSLLLSTHSWMGMKNTWKWLIL